LNTINKNKLYEIKREYRNNNLSLKSHLEDLLVFVKQLYESGNVIINPAVFNGGFLVGRDYYN